MAQNAMPSSSSGTARKRPTLLLLAIEGSLASCGAVIFSNPLDIVKTRLQLQGELQRQGQAAVHYRGMFHGCFVIGRNEGIRGLQKGLPAAFLWQVSQNGVRFGIYDPVKQLFGRWLPEGFICNLSSAVTAGVLGAVAANPSYLVKTRLQSASATAQVGVQHKYRGIADAFRQIVREKGVAGLFHGLQTSVMRTAVGSGAQLTTYDQTKYCGLKFFGDTLSATDVRLHIMCASASAVMIAIFMNPFDVVMTRCFNDPHHKYSSNPAVAFTKIARVEGIAGLYKGSTALLSRTAPHTVITFLLLEQLKQLRPLWPSVNNDALFYEPP